MADTGSKIVSLNVLSSYDKKRDLLNDDKFVAQEKDKSLMDVTEHDKLADIEDNAQVNAIESISVDGTPLTIDADKNVNIDLTGKVDVETGKSLVEDELITQITTNKDDIETLNGDEETEGSVKKQIKDAIGGITGFEAKVVAALPATGEKGIIYFVPKADAKPGDDIHDEYIWVGEKFEKIGNTEVDLEDYAKTADVVLKDDVDEDTLALLTTKEEGDKKTLLFDGKEIEGGDNHIEITKAELQALIDTGTYDEDAVYFVTDSEGEHDDRIVALEEKVEKIADDVLNIKMLGWTVPHECPIQNYVDSNGVFHQRVGRVDLGGLSWDIQDNAFNTVSLQNIIKGSNTNDIVGNLYCKKYTTVSWNKMHTDYPNKTVATNGVGKYLRIVDTSYTDPTVFQQAMSGAYLYYELATEITKTVDGNEIITKLVSRTAGTGSASDPELLWTNSAPTTAFAAQTINLDLSDYSRVLIKFRTNTSATFGITNIGANTSYYFITDECRVGESGCTTIPQFSLYFRPYNVTNSGIEFTNTAAASVYSTSVPISQNAAYNTVGIPYQIYGII